MPYSDQKKGMLLAFTAIMFITPDSLFIRLSHIDTWGLLFYRGAIPFLVVSLGLLIIYKANFFYKFSFFGLAILVTSFFVNKNISYISVK